MILQGPVGREVWLGVDLCRGTGGVNATGWMQSGELQRRAAGRADWLARLRGKGRGRLECGEPQLDRQCQPRNTRSSVERSSGRVLPASAGGGCGADEEWRSHIEGTDEECGSGQDSKRG